MPLTIQAIPAFKDNYIWIIQVMGSQQVIIVDPGDAEPVLKVIRQQNLIPIALIITHGCHDHVDGIEELLKHYDVPVYGPKNEFIPHITHPLSACDDLVIDPLFPEFRILDIPGHTKGHLGFLIEDKLFCGDALFGAGCGRLHSGPAALMYQSLRKITELPVQTMIYCAHEYTESNLRFASIIEPDNEDIKQRMIDTAYLRQQDAPSIPFALGLELATNPFLRCENPEVMRSTENHKGQALPDPVDVFTALRLRKDRF